MTCEGCPKIAPASAKPGYGGHWLCRRCTDDMKWAMGWMVRTTQRAPLAAKEPAP